MNGLGGANDCISYINKLTNIGALYSSNQPILSASANGYANSNWYFDDNATLPQYTGTPYALYAFDGVLSNGVSFGSVDYQSFTSPTIITNATNVAGYFSWGCDGSFSNDAGFVTNAIAFTGASDWFLMTTTDSYGGQRVPNDGDMSFLTWYSSNAFHGVNYSYTPVGGVSYVDEPYLLGHINHDVYFGYWAAGKSFVISAWAAAASSTNYPQYGFPTVEFQATGDPFVRR